MPKGMSIAGLASIQDPMERLRVAHAMLRRLKRMEELIAYIRDEALLKVRELGVTQQYVANSLDVSRERVGKIEKRARQHIGSIAPPWETNPDLLTTNEKVGLDEE